MANLEQSGSKIPDVWSVKRTFSLKVTFYLIRTENRTKKSLKGGLVLKGVFFETASYLEPPPLILDRGIEFSKFSKKRRGLDFSHKKGGFGKIGGLF